MKKKKKATGHRPQATGKRPRKNPRRGTRGNKKLIRELSRVTGVPQARYKDEPNWWLRMKLYEATKDQKYAPRSNPTRKQRARRKKARKAIRALLHLPGRKNPIPAFLTGIGPALAEGGGFAVGEIGVSELAKKSKSKKRHTMKKKKARGKSKKARGRGRPRSTPKKKQKRNPSRRAAYAIGVGRRAVDTARTKSEARAKAKLLRLGGVRRVRIKEIPKTFR